MITQKDDPKIKRSDREPVDDETRDEDTRDGDTASETKTDTSKPRHTISRTDEDSDFFENLPV